jgi:plasmid maintenance system killer protein
MELFFSSPKQQDLLESDKDLKKEYGPDTAKVIRARLDNLRSAENLAVMSTLPGKMEALKHQRSGTFSLRLTKARGDLRLIFAPHSSEAAMREDGSFDLSRVQAVIILEITDYHA